MKKLALFFAAILLFPAIAVAQFGISPGSRPRAGNDIHLRGTDLTGQIPVSVGPGGSTIEGGGIGLSISPSTTTCITASYTVQTTDLGREIDGCPTSSLNVTLPVASATGFGARWWTVVCNKTTSIIAVVNVVGTIGGNTSPQVYPAQCLEVVDTGTAWSQVPYGILYNASNSQGSLSTAPGDSTAGNGNPRGAVAIDLQLYRTSATQIASGSNSVTIGSGNTASGSPSVAIGDNNTASCAACVAIGDGATASTNNFALALVAGSATGSYTYADGNGTSAAGIGSFAHGQQTSISGAWSVGFGYYAGSSDSGQFTFQPNIFGIGAWGSSAQVTCILGNQTTGATSVHLTGDGLTQSVTNECNLAANTSFAYQGECIITDATAGANAGKSNTYTFGESIATRVTGNIALGSNPTATAGPTGSVGSLTLQAVPTIAADTSNQGFNISYTPPTGNTDTINAVCRLTGTMTAN